MSLNDLRDEVRAASCDKGWCDERRTFGDAIALIHSEASEALEEFRNGHAVTETYFPDAGTYGPHAQNAVGAEVWAGQYGWKPEGVPSELADVIIRAMDVAGEYGIDIEQAVKLKMAYNRTRPHRHGGKRL